MTLFWLDKLKVCSIDKIICCMCHITTDARFELTTSASETLVLPITPIGYILAPIIGLEPIPKD